MRDAYSSVLPQSSIDPGAKTATATGATVDRTGAGKMFQAALILVQTGTITDGSHVISVEESDDNSAWAAVAAGSLQGSAPTLASGGASNNKCFSLGYLGLKRYLRVKSTVSGTTTGGVYGASIVLADPRVLPAQ